MENIDQLEHLAVDAAVRFDWKIAIDLNKKIITLDKKNPAAHLRLAFAFLQTQKYEEAKKIYRKALKIQPSSNVAKENLERIKVLQNKGSRKSKKVEIFLDPNLFLETSGKTKSVVLVNLGQKNALAHLSIGQEVFLKPKKRKVEVRTVYNEYIGSLPDDLSRRLLVFLKAKSVYRIYIKEANLAKVTVFISEAKKGRRVQQYLSFPQNIQSQIQEMGAEKEGDDEEVEGSVVDIEKLAESLPSEEKEYLPYQPEPEEEESEE